MTERLDQLQAADLATLLRALPSAVSDGVAALVVTMRSQVRLAVGELHLDRSLNVRQSGGHDLIPDIVDDLRALARHEPTPGPSYRSMLREIAHRHDVKDDGKRSVAGVERDIMRRYDGALRPDPTTFEDRGRPPLWQRVGFLVPGAGWVAYMLAPHWRVVTAATLEIAAHRRVALARHLRSSLED